MFVYPTLHILLFTITHILQVNTCFLHVQTRHVQHLQCYVCQFLLSDNYVIYLVQGNLMITRLEVVASVIVRSRFSNEDIKYARPNVTQWKQHVLNILHCLYEAHDESLRLFVASLLSEGLDLGRLSLSPLDCEF